MAEAATQGKTGDACTGRQRPEPEALARATGRMAAPCPPSLALRAQGNMQKRTVFNKRPVAAVHPNDAGCGADDESAMHLIAFHARLGRRQIRAVLRRDMVILIAKH